MAHNIMLRYYPSLSAVLLLLSLQFMASSSKSDSENLLVFKESLANHGVLSTWNASTQPCTGSKENWVGVLCENKGNVWGLKLENMGLSGTIDVESLKELPALRTISLMDNQFSGSLPSIKKLGALKTVYLSNNKFSGEIETNAFDGMHSLKKIHLEDNEFSGLIPSSLATLPKLVELSLQGNKFQGKIPEFKQGQFKTLNLSNNELQGQIPAGLSTMNASSFAGNDALCGAPLEACPSSSSKLPATLIAIIAIAAVAAVAAILALLLLLLLRRRRQPSDGPASHTENKSAAADLDKMEQGSASPTHSTTSKKGENSGKLSFLRDNVERFDLADLLKASAEVLGSGCLGASYKAALRTGKVMVVKRFRQMNNVGREEFQEHMRRLGRLSHNNLLPIVAFYYRREEKLLVTEYVGNASLASHLHGKRSPDQPTLDWATRLKIIKGIAKGLLYLNNELPSLTIPHGHLKSSNVLLNESFEPLLTDYGLSPVVNQGHAKEVMEAYKSPEYKQNGRVTKKTDVWSLGMLILETLTGKDSGSDVATWVHSLAREEWAGEVFDKEIMVGAKNGEGEMSKLLKIGLACAEADVEKRWELKAAVEKIEELREKDHDDEFYSSHSEGDVRSSRGLSDDFSFP